MIFRVPRGSERDFENYETPERSELAKRRGASRNKVVATK